MRAPARANSLAHRIIPPDRPAVTRRGPDLSRRDEDANLLRAVTNARLKGSFIYLANAVNDLRGNWLVLAVALAPLVLGAALCLLPDALNLQYRLAATFEPGTQTIGFTQAQSADAPDKPAPPPAAPVQAPQPYSGWVTATLHVVFGLLTLLVTLLTLCALERLQSGARAGGILSEAIEIYRRAIRVSPGFLWVTFLQLLAPASGLLLLQAAVTFIPGDLSMGVYFGLVLMIVLGALVYLWLYFAQYALIFGGRHSFHALLFSRDLMRKRFFKVATRIIVFLAVWSGFNSWAAGTFVVVSLLCGPLGVVTGTLGTTIFLVDLAAIGVSFATAAFFVTAGLRLYQDLLASLSAAPAVSAEQAAMQPTARLGGVPG